MTYAMASTTNLPAHSPQASSSAFDAIFSASPVVQIVLLILISLSIICWAIGFAKMKQFREIVQGNEPFQNRFWKSQDFRSLFEDLDQYRNSAMARLFKAAMLEIQHSDEVADMHSVERALRKAMDTEVAAMESRLTLLATTGSTGPFVGLFGTVWGIMGSFHKIGQTGSASLAVVAPGISEALIATAIGLAAAIPAVVLYNHFIAKIRREEIALNNFTSDFLNMARRQNLVKEI